MNQNQFLRWIEQVYSTREEEIDCTELRALLPAYVDLEIASSGKNLAEDPLACVAAHLAQCPDCAEEHAAILTIAKMLNKGALPPAEQTLASFAETAGETGEKQEKVAA